MATAIESIVVTLGIVAGVPFAVGDVLYVAQVSPAVVRSTPNIFVDNSQNPAQIEIGPLAVTPHATVIGHLATVPAGGAGNQVVIGTSASVAETQDSIAIGHSATTGSVTATIGAIAIGLNATVGGASANAGGGVAIGNGAAANNAVAIGAGATCLLGQVAVGLNALCTNFSVAIGNNTQALWGAGLGSGAIALGNGAIASESTDIVIGSGSGGTQAGQGGNVLIASGNAGTGAQSSDGIAIGANASSGLPPAAIGAGANFSTVIGGNSKSLHQGARLLGRGLVSTATNQTLIGGTDDPAATVVFGNGAVNTAPQNVVIMPTGGSGGNVAGAQLTIAGGIATGSAIGGPIVFQTSVVGGSGSTPQALATALTIDNTQTVTFANPFIATTTAAGAPASKAGTLTNLPAAATAGDPQLYLTFKTSTHTYAIPAWQIA